MRRRISTLTNNSLTQWLRELPYLFETLSNAYVASLRIQSFMDEPDKSTPEQRLDEPSDITFEDCSFCWPETAVPVLRDLNLTISEGLTIVVGKVGAGKTALLQSILGELDLKSGNAVVPNKMMGYCAQTPWLQSMSIRDNILFFTPYNESRYREVLDACELLPDMATFTNGDLSAIGENGIGLSGGQKARVALARAVYSNAPIILLDDPLSALDHSTAELIVRKLFSGNFLKGKTVVLVTHRVDLVRHLASQILRVEDGTIMKLDTISTNGALRNGFPNEDDTADSNKTQEDSKDGVPDKFTEDEHRADWGVQLRVYW
jgi:ABC-type multidrug transport system fused ATPase/permease subunit